MPRPKTKQYQRIGVRDIPVDHFLARVQFNPQTGCEEWTGPVNNAGYGLAGHINPQGLHRMMSAHRQAWMIAHNQEIPPGQQVHHTCHNTLCCTPAHLRLGQHAEKMRDLMSDNRHGFQLHRPDYYNRQNWHQYYDQRRRYTEEDIQFGRSATPEEIQARWHCDLARARKIKRYFRSGYPWLPFDRAGTEMKRGRKPRTDSE